MSKTNFKDVNDAFNQLDAYYGRYKSARAKAFHNLRNSECALIAEAEDLAFDAYNQFELTGQPSYVSTLIQLNNIVEAA